MRETAKRTLNGVPEREFRALIKLEKELYDEWELNTHDINAHNRLRGAMNVLAMCRGVKPRMGLIFEKTTIRTKLARIRAE